MMFDSVFNPAFERILPGFDPNGSVAEIDLDNARFASAIENYAQKRDIFVFGANDYVDERFEKDRSSYKDRAFHEWSVCKISPEFLLVDWHLREPDAVFKVCCALARSLSAKLQSYGERKAAFIAVMTPADEFLDHNAFAFKVVTGDDGVGEFGSVMGEDPQITLFWTASD